MNWQPIETAPGKGDFIAYNPVTGPYLTRREDEHFPMRGWGSMDGKWFPSPTHWMPLPEPPK